MTNFQNKWSKPASPSIGDKIADTFRPRSPLKPKVQMAIARLQNQIAKLDGMILKLNERDTKIFKRVVDATQIHDAGSARVFSNELAEIRKVTKVLGNARMALEQIELRLTTANDIGDTVTTIVPTIGLMKNLKTQLGAFMPSADQEITNMADMLGGIMQDTFSGDTSFGVDTVVSEESEGILREAAAVAETSADNKFPNTPADTGKVANPNDSRYI